MKPIEFNGMNTVFAKNQPEYLPLPAYSDPNGRVTFCWGLSWKERIQILLTGKIWHQVLTSNNPLQPQKLTADRP